MKKIYLVIVAALLISQLAADKYAGEIFRMGAGVRNLALGNTGVADVDNMGLAYWNSALLDQVTENRFELMHASEYSGLLSYDTFSAIFGKKEKMSLVITRIGIDDIPLTKLENPADTLSASNRPYKYKGVNNSDLVAYFGISRKIGKYTIGFTPKIAYRNLAEETGFGFGADISTYFQVKDNMLIGLKVRDFFTSQIMWGNGTNETVNPGFDAEVAYNFSQKMIPVPLKILVGLEFYAEGREEAAVISAGAISADPHFGLEVKAHEKADILLGYDAENITAGLTLNISKLIINYAFENNTELDSSHRVSLGLKL